MTSRSHIVLALFLLSSFFIRLALTAYHKSATYDESLYITYGYSILETGDYRLSIDKPPLVALVAALPLRWMGLKFDRNDEDWKQATSWIGADRPWQDFGVHRWNFNLKFLFRNSVPSDRILRAARLSIATAVTIVVLFIFLLGRRLFGEVVALATLFFLSFDPNLLAHASLTTEDALVAMLVFLSVLCFLRWIEEANIRSGIYLGLSTGLALMAKNSALLLGPIFLLLLIAAMALERIYRYRVRVMDLAVSLAPALGAVALVILISYRFSQIEFYLYNVRNTLLYQARGQATFCWGQYSLDGFWFYYLVCLLLKTPLPILMLLVWACFDRCALNRMAFGNEPQAQLSSDGVSAGGRLKLLAMIMTPLVFLVAGSANRIQIGLRYILPAYPFLLTLAALVAADKLRRGALGNDVRGPGRSSRKNAFGGALANKSQVQLSSNVVFEGAAKIGAAGLCGWFMVSSLAVHPHYLAYFNELAGGSRGGWRYLVDSNLDWGQDLGGVKDYAASHDVSDVILSYYGAAVPETVGIPFQDFYSFGIWGEKNHINAREPKKEILAVSATNLQGVYLISRLGLDGLKWLKAMTPVGNIGHSIYLYDITRDARAHEWLAHDYLSGGMTAQTRREAARALAIDPKSSWALLLSSFLSLEDGKIEESLKAFDQAAHTAPPLNIPWKEAIQVRYAQEVYARHLAGIGREALRRTRIDTAGMASQLASQIDPSYVPAWETLAQALYFKGMRKESAEIARRVLKLDPSNIAMKKLALGKDSL